MYTARCVYSAKMFNEHWYDFKPKEVPLQQELSEID